MNLHLNHWRTGMFVLLMLAIALTVSRPALAEEPAYVPDEVIVILKDTASSDNLTTSSIKEKGIRGKIVKKTKLSRVQKNLLRLKLDAGLNVKDAIDENWGSKDPRILRVEPNYLLFAQALPNDSSFSQQWALYNYGQTGGTANCHINAAQAWDITTGANVVVAVIDTGVDYTHPDLVNQMWVNPGEIAGNGIDDDGNGYIDDIYGFNFAQDNNTPFDDNGHGTHCAGVIAARGNNGIGIAGISWGAKIMACRFLGANGSGTVSDAIEAINYAVANGARILNNSWGGTGYSAALETAIQNAKNNGVLFVAAAGNSAKNNDVTPHYPSSYPIANIISVSATNHNDALASFSCYGKQSVHIGAPGVSILSTVPGGYAIYSGTSMAAPQVSGTAALLLSMNPAMSLLELKDRLIWTGNTASGLAQTTVTGLRLNAQNALAVQNTIQVTEPAAQTQWCSGFSYSIRWISIGAAATVNVYLVKNGNLVQTIAENIANTGNYDWAVPTQLVNGSDYAVRVTDGTLSGQSGLFTLSNERVDYYTELFLENVNPFDLCQKSVLFVPVEGGGYEAIARNIDALPSDATVGARLRLGDDDAMYVGLNSGQVQFFGQDYPGFYVGSNGYITFNQPDYEYRTGTDAHFSKKRLSVFFADLNPAAGGAVYCKEMADRITVTWLNVPVFGRSTPNTFSAELFFDGKIRLSWLETVRSKTLAGLSNGSGKAGDFLDTDFSAYNSYTPVLKLIAIEGETTFKEDQNIQLRCMGYFEQQIVEDLTDHGDINWNSSAESLVIGQSGKLMVQNVDVFWHVAVSAQIGDKTDRIGLLIKGEQTEDIIIQKGVIKADTIVGGDSLNLNGRLTLTKDALQQAEAITVKLWSSQNECLREASYPVTEKTLRKSLFLCTQREVGSPEGGARQLRIDTAKGLFRYSLRTADLSGLDTPSYLTIECGDYAGVGQLDHTNINKGKSIPAKLMDGLADTLYFSKMQVINKPDRRRDSLYAEGQFSLVQAADTADDTVLSMNSQEFTFPAAFSTARKGVQTFRYTDGSGQAVYSQLNFNRGTFKMRIQKTDVECDTKKINFGLKFNDFNKSQKKGL